MRFLFTRLLILFLLLGCGGSEDDQSQELDNAPVITSIEVYVSSEEIIVGQQVLLVSLIIQEKIELLKLNFM